MISDEETNVERRTTKKKEVLVLPFWLFKRLGKSALCYAIDVMVSILITCPRSIVVLKTEAPTFCACCPSARDGSCSFALLSPLMFRAVSSEAIP